MADRNWLIAHRWLLLRRFSQLGVLGLFLLGPWAGVWIVTGNLTSSLTLDVLPLTDPYVLLQSFVAGHAIASTALIGALIVSVTYMLVGGRMYCSWVCPINMVTDLAQWLRDKLGIKGSSIVLNRQFRYWVFAMTLIASYITGQLVWEFVNPVSMLHRGLIFGMGLTAGVVFAVFIFDLLISRRGWCGHVCPVGVFYGFLGRTALLRINANQREKCDDCMECFQICPEQQVIKPALKGAGTSWIQTAECTNCGRCIDVCDQTVFRFQIRGIKN
ncbi:quinol dehydrogenase ferredoxin subunit NapH [Candidatus Albibeggiatoa sp. nov. NOAA]|uniref:quinol dehydrogenase ferredoxin subunit NapH n=1 Tax=Candidatus Albibeggiatoa sp. nov. NOAA TaxID=3162724 RepID=UPI00330347B7|nr:quinol dehydrogenase ferredoxin subunit NapH [Thiotrichaceae bacterium]